MEMNNKIDENENLHWETQLSVMEMEYQRKIQDVNEQMESLRAESETNEKVINESIESQKMIVTKLNHEK